MIVRTYQTEVSRSRLPRPKPPAAPRHVHKAWTEQCVAALDDCIACGFTLSQAARKLNRTRNSVIGFDWRRRQR